MSMTGRYMRIPPDVAASLLTNPSGVEELAFPEHGDSLFPKLNIDKSWHLIHYLLNGPSGTAEGPLAAVILGGNELEGTDSGYGPYRILDSPQVALASEALSSVSGAEMWDRFDVDKVEAADIYPNAWTGETYEKEYILQKYSALQEFFGAASQNGDAILVYLS